MKIKTLVTMVAFLLVGISSYSARAETRVGGIITQDTTWTPANNPVIIIRNVLVPDGVTLKIDPGVEVKFDGFFLLQIEGILIAQGTKSRMIKFTSNKANPKAGDWQVILFTPVYFPRYITRAAIVDQDANYVSGPVVSYAEISFGQGIQLNDTQPYLSNNLIYDMAGTTIPGGWGPPTGVITTNLGAHDFATQIVKDNIIVHNDASGIVATALIGGTIKIIGNTIQRNRADKGGGIRCLSGASCTITNNIILQNEATTGGGVFSDSWRGHIITQNVIANNCTTSEIQPYITWGDFRSSSTAVAVRGASVVSYNSIEGNYSGANGDGVAIVNSGPLNYNNISNPTEYELYLFGGRGTRQDAIKNYWGTTDENAISARIWDADYDFNLADVDFLPILNWPEPGAPKLDPQMLEPMTCGCGVANTDTDGDGFADCNDSCPKDSTKQAIGQCGCGNPDTDSDGDKIADCNDQCPNDAGKIQPGTCGCGVPDTDSDSDGTADCKDLCPNDKNKQAPGVCGCGMADVDADKDSVVDCNDRCPNTPQGAAVDTDGCPTPPVCTITVAPGKSGDFVLTYTSPGSYIMEVTSNGKSIFSTGKQGGDVCTPGRCIGQYNVSPRVDTTYKLAAEGPGGACCQEISFQSGSFGSPRNCVVPFRPTPPPAAPLPPSPSPPSPSKSPWWKIWEKVIPSKEPAAPTKKTMERLY